MCFSASASFTLAAVLTGIGAGSVARATSPSRLTFAAVPFGFAAQQASEGIVWLTVGQPAHHEIHRATVFAFLTFALVVWPTWIPTGLHLAEPPGRHRRTLGKLAWFGALVSIVAAVLVMWQEPHALIDGFSVRYTFGADLGPAVHLLLIAGYIVATLAPFFVSSMSLSRWLGVGLVVALGITIIIRREALTSVWCFFAAILSVMVVFAVSSPTPSAPMLSDASSRRRDRAPVAERR